MAEAIKVTATFTLTTNVDKTLSGSVDASGLKSSGGGSCFASVVTLQPGMPEGTSEGAGIAFDLFGKDTSGTSLWVNAYATNPDGSSAAVGEDDPTDGSNGTMNDGTNNSYTAFYGISGGPCDGMGGGDAPYQRVTKKSSPPQKGHGPNQPLRHHGHHRFHHHARADHHE